MEDREIIERMQGDDPGGLKAMLLKHGEDVKRTLARRFALPPRDHSLEDAVHEAAMIMFRSNRAERLDSSRSLFGYLLKTAFHELLRIRKKEAELPQPIDCIEELAVSPDADEDPEQESPFVEALRNCLKTKLSKQERKLFEVLLAHDFDISAADIAKKLRTTSITVDSTKFRAKKKLAAFLEEWRTRKHDSGDQGPETTQGGNPS